MNKRIRQKAGFSLLEVVIALLIIAGGFVAVLQYHSQTLSLAGDIRFYSNAVFLAQSKLAEFESDLRNVSEPSGEFGEGFEGFSYDAEITDLDESEVLGDAVSLLKQVKLTINFGDNYSYEITVVRYAGSEE